MLPLRQHKQQSQEGWCKRCEGALREGSYGEIEIVVLFFCFLPMLHRLCCVSSHEGLGEQSCIPLGQNPSLCGPEFRECQHTFTVVHRLPAQISQWNAEYYAYGSEYVTYASEVKKSEEICWNLLCNLLNMFKHVELANWSISYLHVSLVPCTHWVIRTTRYPEGQDSPQCDTLSSISLLIQLCLAFYRLSTLHDTKQHRKYTTSNNLQYIFC